MLQDYEAENYNDKNGNPAGGYVEAVGLSINWQDRPLGRGEDRRPVNGAFVETVIVAAIQRLQFYQEGKFACDANHQAITKLAKALEILQERTREREARAVEGVHAI